MTDFDSHINIDKFSQAKDSPNYVTKEIEIDSSKLTIYTPFKILEGKKINKDYIKGGEGKDLIFESGVTIDQKRLFENLYYVLEEVGKDKIKRLDSLFGLRKNLWDSSLTTTSLFFNRNPFIENKFWKDKEKKETVTLSPLAWDIYDELLDYMHSASSSLVLSPDIQIDEKISNYTDFVDHSVKTLSDWNNKPIFVPLQIDLSKANRIKILEHYAKRKYTNIWVNFKASHIGGSYFTRVRSLVRDVNNILGLQNVALYFSHIKKEVGPDINSNYAIGSDVMSHFFGADFIGINREPRRWVDDTDGGRDDFIKVKGFKNEVEYQKANLLHKRRIFDPPTYYYYKLTSHPQKTDYDSSFVLGDIEKCKLLNSLLIHAEFENAKKVVKEKKKIKSYIKEKRAFIEDEKLFKNIVMGKKTKKQEEKETQKDLLTYLAGN